MNIQLWMEQEPNQWVQVAALAMEALPTPGMVIRVPQATWKVRADKVIQYVSADQVYSVPVRPPMTSSASLQTLLGPGRKAETMTEEWPTS